MMFSENDFSGLDNPAKVRTASTPNFFFEVFSRLYEVDSQHIR